jgi:ribose transport system permease protein
MKAKNTEKRGLTYHFVRSLDTYTLLIMTALLVVFFLIGNPAFLSVGNLFNLVQQNAALIIVAIGMTFVVISGNIDLSSGSVIVFTSCLAGIIFSGTGNIWLALAACVAMATVIGAFNGFLIAKLGINPVIVTLSCMIWARGLGLAITNASSILIESSALEAIYQPFLFGFVNISLIIVVVCFILGWFLLNNTKFGRYTFAIGENEKTTEQAGINTKAVVWLIFILAAFLMGIASVVDLARLGSSIPTIGVNMELDAIVAVVIGGNKLSGGYGSFSKTLCGLLFMCILSNGLSTLGVSDDLFFLIKGGIILAALAAQVTSNSVKTNYMRAVHAK